MTLIDVAVHDRLVATTSSTYALVGARVYYDEVPMGATLPAISLVKVSDIPDPEVPGHYTARVQASCWSDPQKANGERSPAEVEGLAAAVVADLHRPRLTHSVLAWAASTKTYSIMTSRIANAPRVIEDVSGWFHVPVDVLLEFRED